MLSSSCSSTASSSTTSCSRRRVSLTRRPCSRPCACRNLRDLRVDAVVTVIDAASFAAQHGGSGAGAAASDGWWASSEAARQQLFHADLVVLNKKDLVTPAQLHEVRVRRLGC